ncbi:MAG: metal ABC transporter substrate-binding protein [Gemmatimonadota bacterium]
MIGCRFRRAVIALAALPLMASGTTTRAVAQEKVRVVTTLPVFAELMKEIGGDRVTVEAVASPIQDPHFVDAKPSYILDAGRADIWVEAGMSLEIGWAPLVLQGSRNGDIQPGGPGYVNASSHVQKLGVPVGRLDRSRGDVHPEGNPHYWLDPLNTVPITADITLALSRIDPANAGYYTDRRRAFLAELDRRMGVWEARMAPLRGQPVVSYHESWEYFARRFGLDLVGQLEPKPGIPPSPSHLARLIERMRAVGAKLILVEPYYEKKNPELVARETGAEVVELPNQPGAGTDSYFGMIDQIVGRLTAASGSAGTATR